ncbi:hypothetical protein TVAG_295040 [Trichomonas vaginalis G3]|uniref:Uncharacterized protein n=1 Tax=Trichomonas vaginalis (strain ATCC PRA-98 / G3) TaxID=412133 RepID=A2DL61_TRIV3|nr:hypothetical protein TVAGG3_0273610 [Trichomonas vaginalis G3]EAY18852.1 hypothetical protein TVAG_295040 [Trichomonas vaginalis G3]KAI5526042.1 hypothetical protein TVAGG3_0273610 [Trichomonas vaginalis G3]|eukprot:XP_001579838.1 hypothetical protein [Trichomonas vaginalis G3]
MMVLEAARLTTFQKGCNILQASQWYDFTTNESGAAIYFNPTDKDSNIWIKCCYFERCFVPEGNDGAMFISCNTIDLNCVAASDIAAKQNQFGTIEAVKRKKFTCKFISTYKSGMLSSCPVGESNNILCKLGLFLWETANITHSEVSGDGCCLTPQDLSNTVIKFTHFLNSKADICIPLRRSISSKKIIEKVNFVNLTSTTAVIMMESQWVCNTINIQNCRGPIFKMAVVKTFVTINDFYFDFSFSDYPGISVNKKFQTDSYLIPISDNFLYNRYRWNLN